MRIEENLQLLKLVHTKVCWRKNKIKNSCAFSTRIWLLSQTRLMWVIWSRLCYQCVNYLYFSVCLKQCNLWFALYSFVLRIILQLNSRCLYKIKPIYTAEIPDSELKSFMQWPRVRDSSTLAGFRWLTAYCSRRNKFDRCRVDTISFARRRGSILEHVAHMSVALGAPDFRPHAAWLCN